MSKASQDAERYARYTLGRTIKALVEELEAAAQEIRELGCTCVADCHHNDDAAAAVACNGYQRARRYEALTRRVRRRAGVQEPQR